MAHKAPSISKSSLREALILSFSLQDKPAILSQIKTSPHAFEIVLDLIKELVESDATDNTEKAFIIDFLTTCVEEFGIPVVLGLRQDYFLDFLEACLANELSKPTLELLKACLQKLGLFYSRKIIPQYTDLYNLHAASRTSFDDVQSKFMDVFSNFQEVLNLLSESYGKEESRAVLIAVINSLLENDDIDDPSFNVLEKDLISHYKATLKAALEDFQREKDEARKAREERESYINMLKNLPAEKLLKNRTFFIQGENLLFEEGDDLEYKDYALPLTEALERTLSRTMCGFLNTKGGRIYVGVTDSKIVKGINLDRAQKIEFQEVIYKCFSNFEPNISCQDLINVIFLPIYNNANTNVPIPGLFIVKILVKQGETNMLYSITKSSVVSYIRNESNTKLLTSAETKEIIIQRYLSAQPKLPAESFQDPAPAPVSDVDVDHYDEVKTQESPSRMRRNHHTITMRSQILEEPYEEFAKSSDADDNDKFNDMRSTNGFSFDNSLVNDQIHLSEIDTDTQGYLGRESLLSFEKMINEDVTRNRIRSDLDRMVVMNSDRPSDIRFLGFEHSIHGKFSVGRVLEHQVNSMKQQSPVYGQHQNGLNKAATLSDSLMGQIGRPSNGSQKGMSSSNLVSPGFNKDSARKSNQSTVSNTSKTSDQKEYFSDFVKNVNNLPVKGKTLVKVKVHEIFVEGLPTTWSQADFDEFLANTKLSSIISNRMFKKDSGLCNGKAFVNFGDNEEAQSFLNEFNGSTQFGEPLKAKFK